MNVELETLPWNYYYLVSMSLPTAGKPRRHMKLIPERRETEISYADERPFPAKADRNRKAYDADGSHYRPQKLSHTIP